MKDKRYLLVGLGNPPLPLTRHSVGHMALDYLVEKWKLEWKVADQGHFAQLSVDIEPEIKGDLWLFKPLSFMNLCGDFVLRASKMYSQYVFCGWN
jgi:PTH1 family peptidyl-tRNA hydrolase